LPSSHHDILYSRLFYKSARYDRAVVDLRSRRRIILFLDVDAFRRLVAIVSFSERQLFAFSASRLYLVITSLCRSMHLLLVIETRHCCEPHHGLALVSSKFLRKLPTFSASDDSLFQRTTLDRCSCAYNRLLGPFGMSLVEGSAL
jgi:hypothetical protein